jgi:4'-phosphopantetheinyl transferase
MSWKEVAPWPLRRQIPAAVSSAFFKTCEPRLLQRAGLGADIWVISLPRTSDGFGAFWQVLSPDERQRANEFYRPSDSSKFVSSHAALRIVLAHYVETAPRHLRFVCGAHGKPAIDPGLGLPDIRFNLSHSGNRAVVAVSMVSEVGIDIERVEPARAKLAIAERFFSPQEFDTLRTLPQSDRVLAFFSCWTRKEAYLKARGDGLSLQLSEFDVSLAPEDPPALLGSRTDASEPNRWRFVELLVDEGYVACLAIENPTEDHQTRESVASHSRSHGPVWAPSP